MTITALIGQRDALIGQIQTSRQASEANFSFNELNALIDSLRAAKTLQDWPGYLPKPDPQLEPQVVQTLRKVFYVVKEQNRWENLSGFKKMFLSDDKLLVIAEEKDGNLSLKDYLSENPEKQLAIFEEQHKGFFEVAFSHDGKTIATADKNGTVRLWSIEGKKLATFQGYQSSSDLDIYRITISFSHDSKQMSILFHDANSRLCSVGLWDLSGNKPRELKKQSGSFLGGGFHSNGRLVVSKWAGTNLTLSYFLSGKELKVFTGYMGGPWTDFLVSNNGEKLLALYDAAGGDANLANVIHLNNGNRIESWDTSNFLGINIDTASFSPDGEQMAIAIGISRDIEEDENVIYLFESNDTHLKSPVKLRGHQSYISQVTFSPHGQQLASTGGDNTIRLWDLKDKPIEQLGLKKGIPDISSMSLNLDGRQLAVVKKDGTVSLLNLNGKELKSFSDLQGKVSQVTFSPDGRQLAVVKKDGTVSLLNLNGKELKSFSDLQGKVSQVTFSPDGRQLAVLENDETRNKSYISSFNVKTREKKLDLQQSSYQRAEYIGFSPQGNLIEAKDSVTGLFISDLQSNNKALSRLNTGHVEVESLAFSPDGSLLASANDYRKGFSIIVWNLSGKQLFAWEGHGEQVKSMSFSADGNLLATLGEDGTTKIWRFGGLNELLERGCDRVRNYLKGDYLKNNPNVNPSDRRICDGIRDSKHNNSTPVTSPISSIPSPAPYPNDQTSVPDISETATNSSLTQEAAVDLVRSWLQEKNKVLAPPFDLQVLARYTTGRYFQKYHKAVGWLKSNDAYYQFELPLVEEIEIFAVENNQATVGVKVTESLSLYSQGRAKPSQHTTEYNLTLQLENGQWKIEDSQQLTP